MRFNKYILSALLSLLLLPHTLFAQNTVNEERWAGYSIILDQDFLSPWSNEDRNYTMGLVFNFSGGVFADLPTSWVTRKLSDVFWKDNLALTKHELSIVGNGFTPEDLGERDVIVGDRPYGSFLGFSTRRLIVPLQEDNHKLLGRYRSAVRTEFAVGALGLGVAEFVQTEIHQIYRAIANSDQPVDPLGWDNQISQGGEPTLLLRASYEQRFSVIFRCIEQQAGDCERSVQPYDKKYFEATWLLDGSVGYYTNIAAGVRMRLGIFQSEFWDFDSSQTNIISQGVDTPGNAQGKRGVEFFIFGGLTGRLVGYNALLQGQFKDSAYTLDADQLNRTILEFQVGPVISFPLSKSRRLGIGYLFSGRTAEFSGPFERTHSWGGLSITIGRPPVIN